MGASSSAANSCRPITCSNTRYRSFLQKTILKCDSKPFANHYVSFPLPSLTLDFFSLLFHLFFNTRFGLCFFCFNDDPFCSSLPGVSNVSSASFMVESCRSYRTTLADAVRITVTTDHCSWRFGISGGGWHSGHRGLHRGSILMAHLNSPLHVVSIGTLAGFSFFRLLFHWHPIPLLMYSATVSLASCSMDDGLFSCSAPSMWWPKLTNYFYGLPNTLLPSPELHRFVLFSICSRFTMSLPFE